MHRINVSLVYAEAAEQHVFEAQVDRGTSALDLVKISGFLSRVDALTEMPEDNIQLGNYSQKVAHDYLLEEGDRIEIYRPLTADPKEVRRQLALLGKTIGKSVEAKTDSPNPSGDP